MSYDRNYFKGGYQPKTGPDTPPTPPTGGSSVDKRCGCKNCTCKEAGKAEVRTNYEEIVNYNIDEMAKFLAGCFGGGKVREKAMKVWLKSEAE